MGRWWMWLFMLHSSVLLAGNGRSQLSNLVASPQTTRSSAQENNYFFSLKKIINARLLQENIKQWREAINKCCFLNKPCSAGVEFYASLKRLLEDEIEAEDSTENPRIALFNAYIQVANFEDVTDEGFRAFVEWIARLEAPKVHLELIGHIGAKLENLAWGEHQMSVYLNHVKNEDIDHEIGDFDFVYNREMVETDAYLLSKGWDSKTILRILPSINTSHFLELLKFAELHNIVLPEYFLLSKWKEYRNFVHNSQPDVSLLAFQEALKTRQFFTDHDLELLFRVRTQTDLTRFIGASHFVFDTSVVAPRFIPLAVALKKPFRNKKTEWKPWQEQMFSFFSGLIPREQDKISKEFCFLEAQPELFPVALRKINSEEKWNVFKYYVYQGVDSVDRDECQAGPISRLSNPRIALFDAYSSRLPQLWTDDFFSLLNFVGREPHPDMHLQVTQVIGNDLANLRQPWGEFQMKVFLQHQAHFNFYSNIDDWCFVDNKAMAETDAYLLSKRFRLRDIKKILPHIRTCHYLKLIRFADNHQIVLPPEFLEAKLKEYQSFFETQEDYTLLALRKGIKDLGHLTGDDLKLVMQVKTKADYERLERASSYAYTSTLATTHERFHPFAKILRDFLFNKEETWAPWQEEMYSFFEDLRPTESIFWRSQKIFVWSPKFCFIEAHPELGPSIMSHIETPSQFEVFKFYVTENAKRISFARCQQRPLARMNESLTPEEFNLTPIQFTALKDEASKFKGLPVDLHKFDFLQSQTQYEVYQLLKRTGINPFLYQNEISSISSSFQALAARLMLARVPPGRWSQYFKEILQIDSLLDAYAVCSLISEYRNIRGVTQLIHDESSSEDVRSRVGIKNSIDFSVFYLMERFGHGYAERAFSPDYTRQILKKHVRHPAIIAQILNRPDSARIAGVLEAKDLFHCADSSCIAWGKKEEDYQCEACHRTGCIECGKRSHNHQNGCDSFLNHGYVNPELFPGYANMESGISNICFFNAFLKMFSMIVATSSDLKEWLAMPYQGPMDENETNVEASAKLKSILFELIDDTLAGEVPKIGIGDLQRSLMDQLHVVAKLKGRAQIVKGFGSDPSDSLVAFIEVLSAIGFEYSNMQVQISALHRVIELKYNAPLVEEKLFNIELPVFSCDSVQSCLNSFFKLDHLNDFQVKKIGYPALRFKGVTNRPPFLLLHLARFASNGKPKDQKRIRINKFITVSQKSPEDPRKETALLRYQLTAAVTHSGTLPSYGHYRAFLFDPNQADLRPVEHNDRVVKKASEYSWIHEVESDGYLLSYKLVDVEECANVQPHSDSCKSNNQHTWH